MRRQLECGLRPAPALLSWPNKNTPREELLISIPLLALLCFGITVAYASVGLGDDIYLVPRAGAVAIGALIGGSMGASWLSRRTERRVLGAIVLIAITLLLDDLFRG